MKSNSYGIELQKLGNKANSNGLPKVTFNANDDREKILDSAPVLVKDEIKQLKKQSSSAATIEEDEEDGRRKSKFYDSKKNYGPDWVLKTFRKKACMLYVPKADKKDFCCCGRSKDAHGAPIRESEIKQNIGVKWDIEKHTKDEGTNAYGDIQFHGAGKKTRAKYIRLTPDTKPLDVLKLLLREWRLDLPKLLISVTGGAKFIRLSPKLKQLFSEGLCQVVRSTGAWVITGGTNTGVMKYVGEALQGITTNIKDHEYHKTVCIGISSWGIVTDRNKLACTGETVNYHITSSFITEGACLDNNHTHFLLVDNGSINKYGCEIEFRGILEKAIRDMKHESRGIEGIPGVQLVLEGGPNTIRTVHAAITQKPPMPVIVIKGSGRAADLLAFAVSISHSDGPLFEMADVVKHSQLMNMVERTFPELDQKGCNNVYKNILECMTYKEHIIIYRMDDEGHGSIDEAILTAFLKGKHIKASYQLNLAMLWNRVDIARTKIFIEGAKWKEHELEQSMKNALIRNKPNFVELLLENGVSMARFLTVERLESLYNSRVHGQNNVLRALLGDELRKNSNTVNLSDISNLLSRLLYMRIRPEGYINETRTIDQIVIPKVSPRNQSFSHPYNELFIWAVLNNLPDMAFCFWTRGEEALAKALIGSRLFQQMAKVGESEHILDDIVEKLKNNSEKFRDLAVQLLNECYYSDEVLTGQLVTYNLENWGQQTCLSIAVTLRHLEFVAHSSCQNLITRRWTGALHMPGRQAWKVFLCIVLPPFIFWLRFRSQKEYSQIIMTEAEHKEYTEIELEVTRKASSKNLTSRQSKEKRDSGHDRSELISNSNLDDSSHSDSIIIKGSTLSSKPLTVGENDEYIPWHVKMRAFYKAPVTKFWSNVYAYLLFLALFTFVVTTKLPVNPFRTEWILVVVVFAYGVEEIRQIIQSDVHGVLNKIKSWASSYWNICDLVAIILFFTGLGLRLNSGTRVAGHVCYAIDIMIWIIRLLDIFSVNKYLGPYVVMIGKMTIDMAYFIFILLVFLVAYGIARYVILNPDKSRSFSTFGEILMIPYFQIYGELFLEIPQDNDNETIFSSTNHHDHIEPLVALIMAFYLMVANILLLNLLIAIFNNTYSKVQANSNMIWKFQRYNLIQEYSIRPALVPPLSFLVNCYDAVRLLLKWCRNKDAFRISTDRKLKYFPEKDALHDLMLFEERCLMRFLRKRHTVIHATQDEKLRMISERVDNISNAVSEINLESIQSNRRIAMSLSKLEEKNANLEQNIKVLSLNLNHIQNALKDKRIIDVKSPSYHRKEAFHNNWARSISEYPITSDYTSLTGKHQPSSPTSLPNAPFQNQKYQRLYSSESDKDSASTLYPNFQEDKQGAVRRAVFQFRKGSLESDTVLKDYIEGIPKKDSSGSSSPSTANIPVRIQSKPVKEKGEKDNFATIHRELQPVILTNQISRQSYPDEDFSGHADNYDEVDSAHIDLYFPHVLSRSTVYPLTSIHRYRLPDHLVPWKVPMPEYKPPEYTSSAICTNPKWADEDITESSKTLNFNDMDGNIDRKSSVAMYEIVDCIPRNPMGRTGLRGRGLLGRYGPNHVSTAVITRWCPDTYNVTSHSKTLEVLVVPNKSKESWTLPQGIKYGVQHGIPEGLAKLFSQDTLIKIGLTQFQVDLYTKKLDMIISNAAVVHKGYLDDERNTDNAWLENTVHNYHEEENVFSKYLLSDDARVLNIRWLEADCHIDLPVEQVKWIEEVSKLRNAYFC